MVNSDGYSDFEKLQSEAEKMNISIFVYPNSNGGQYLYIQKCYVGKLLELMEQQHDISPSEQQQDKLVKKRCSR